MGFLSFILTISLYLVIFCYLEEGDSNGDSLGPIDAGKQYFVYIIWQYSIIDNFVNDG